MRRHAPVIALVLGLATAPVMAAGDVAAGKALAPICGACHGADGNSTNPLWPKLAGQHAGYIESQLKAFKEGTRQDPVMTPQAMILSDEDAANVAAFFEAQPPSGGFADDALVARGERIYRGGISETGVPACMSCHGPAGTGDPLGGFPTLAGQHATYVEKQLNDFRSGARHSDAKSMMRDTVRWLSADEIKALASYIAGLH